MITAEAFRIKQGDTLPKLAGRLLLADGSVPDGLSTATGRFLMRERPGLPAVVDGPILIANAVTGAFEYDWQPGQTNRTGTYQAEVEVTFAGGKVLTFPNDGYFSVQFTGEIG